MRAHRWIFIGFFVVGAFFFITEHRAHVLGWLPFILLATCPLMHLFMHSGHDGHGGDIAHEPHHENNHSKT